MARTQVLNTEEARQLATFIRSLSEDFIELQSNIQNKLDGTVFSGNASDVADGIMSEFKARMKDHKARLDQYSNALDEIASSSDSEESNNIVDLRVSS